MNLRAIQVPSYPMTVNLYSTRKHPFLAIVAGEFSYSLKLHDASVLFARVQIRGSYTYEGIVNLDEELYHPLVPDLAVVGLPPEAHQQLAVVRELDRLLDIR
jgi:hypothetical protein